MIEEISIRDLGVIADAKLTFEPGLTVLTGETGAGKTMVLTALGLLLGERSDSTSVRQGQEQAFVEGHWKLPAGNEVFKIVSDAGGSLDGDELIVNRSVSRDGRSRASLGGASTPVSVLAQVGESLVAVHGQSDQIRLKSSNAQREALDKFAGNENLLTKYRELWNGWREVSASLEKLKSDSASRETELLQLREALAELNALKPVAGEDVSLAESAEKLTHSEELRIAASQAHDFLSSEGFEDAGDAIALVGKARRALENVSAHDPELETIASTLREIGFQLGEQAAGISGYLASIEGDTAAELERIQERRAALSAAMRKFGPSLEEMILFHESAEDRIQALDSSDENLQRITAERDSLFAQASELAEQLTKTRKDAASKLQSEVSQELEALAMGGASLVVSVEKTEELGLNGADQISLMLSAYPGAEPRPLGKGASGGELSRIMLAIEVVLAKTEQALTFIFDEVDAGVGGASAIEVGRRLAALAKVSQVIVVTHLGQVAAFANHHLRVLKTVGDQFTASDVVTLTGESRVEEIARMLSGMADSESAKANARELMSRAAEFSSR